MSLHRRILAALIALAFLSLAPVHGAATLDRAMCSVADRAAGNPATCEGSEGVDSANQELSKLYDGSVLVATVGGSANAITGSTTPSAPALVDGMMRQIKPIVSNTGAATYNDNGLGAKQLVASNGAALSSGDLQTTTVYLMHYYAANDEWRVLTPLGTGVASASNAYVTVGNTGSLSAERAITPDGTTITGTDGGANSTYGLSLTNNGVSNAKLAQMPANTIKGNNTGATANAADLTASQVKTVLAITGADVSNTPAGNIAATTAQAAINELDAEKQPLDADLTCFAALTSAADKIAYFTGAGTCAVTDFSSAIRTLITTPSSANLRAMMSDEVGTGPLVFLGTPADDSLAVGDSTTGTTWRALPTTSATQKLSYDQATNSFSAAADDDVPDAGEVDDTALAAGAVDGGLGGEIADGSITADDLGTASVGSDEAAALDAADTTTGSFADARIDGSLEADEVNPTLGAQTQGNYMSGISGSAGVAVSHTPAEGSTAAVTLDYQDQGANPTLAADACQFTSNATVAGNIVCEGDTADTFETRIAVTDPTADRTLTVPNADTVTVQGTTCGGTDKVSGIDATTGAITCSADAGGSGSGTPVAINGSSSASMNLSGTTPAAPAGGQNVTWQVSAGSPDQVSAYVPLNSSTTQVTFNDGGSALGGDADMTWDKTNNTFTLGGTDTEAVIKGVTNEPSAPSSGNLTLYTKDMGGKMTARVKGPSGAAFPLQDALWQGSQYVWTTTGATAGLWTNTVGAGAGTFTAQTSVSTSPYTAMKRSRWANVVTTTNQVLGQRNTDATFYVGANGGFFYAARFGFDVWTNGGRLCACMHTATTVVSSNPSTIANTVGFIIDAADNGLISFSTRDGTTLNKTSTGLTAVTGNGYEVQMFIPPGGSTIAWRILDMNAGTVASGSTSSNLPVAGTLMTAGVLASNAALTPVTSIQLGVSKIYVQTDN
jgi:hypothetical protein